MPESYLRLPAESTFTGKKFRAMQRTYAGSTVLEQYSGPAGEPTHYVFAPAQACAQNKYFWAFFNGAASTKVRTVRKLFLQNAQLPAIVSGIAPATVGMMQFDFLRITAVTGGTAITATPVDTNDPTLTNYSAYYGATGVTDSTVLFSWFTNNDELGLTGDISQGTIQAFLSLVTESPWGELRDIELQPGQGLAVKQITNFTLGQFSVLGVLSEDP